MRVIYIPRVNEELQGMNDSNIHLTAIDKKNSFATIPVIKQPMSRYESCRKAIFHFMERPKSRIATLYHIMNFILIIVSMIMSVLSTIDTYEKDPFMVELVFCYEVGILCWFSVEYLLRVWASSYLSKYRGFGGKLRYMKTLYMLIDLFVIVSTFTTAILHIKDAMFPLFRITRLLQFFRVLHLDRRRGDLRTMGRIVSQHKKELLTSYFVGFIILFGGTYIIYICEKTSDTQGTNKINNMANGLYWAMITVTSVGYGDFSPETWAGKMLGGVFALVGCAFFALPAGILGSGFALQVAKQKKQARYRKLRQPAAIAIQTFWRHYAVRSGKDYLTATWSKYFTNTCSKSMSLLPMVEVTEDLLPEKSTDSLIYSVSSSTYDGCISRLSKSPEHTLNENEPLTRTPKISSESCSITSTQSTPIISDLHSLDPKAVKRNLLDLPKVDDEYIEEMDTNFNTFLSSKRRNAHISLMIKPEYKGALKFIFRCKFYVAIRSFKNCRYPFVNMQDIMEKSAHRHSEIIRDLHDMKRQFSAVHKEMLELRSTIELLNFEINTMNSESRKSRRGSKNTALYNKTDNQSTNEAC